MNNPSIIFHSSLQRSIETAQIISKEIGIKSTLNKLLDEQFMGSELDNKDPNSKGYVNHSESYLGGETYKELEIRAENIKNWLLNDIYNANPKEKIVLVTHGRIMTFLLAVLLNLNPNGFFLAIENTSYYIIQISDNWRPMLVLPIPENIYY